MSHGNFQYFDAPDFQQGITNFKHNNPSIHYQYSKQFHFHGNFTFIIVVNYTKYIRYPKEILKMERHFSGLQRWLQK